MQFFFYKFIIIYFRQNCLLESHSLSKYSARFDGLKAGTSYDIQVATELAGKTVVQTRHTFKTLQRHSGDSETASTAETRPDTDKSGPG